jgi:hypothetical protein
MWELLTGEEPYAELHYGAIIGRRITYAAIIYLILGESNAILVPELLCLLHSGGIVNNTLRPPVPESCDPQWRSLMERCWSAEPSERPSFTEVGKSLRAMASPTKAQQSK